MLYSQMLHMPKVEEDSETVARGAQWQGFGLDRPGHGISCSFHRPFGFSLVVTRRPRSGDQFITLGLAIFYVSFPFSGTCLGFSLHQYSD